MAKKDFIENVHYYLENGLVVFTAKYLLDKELCCGKKCRHCPYNPKYIKNNSNVIV